MKKDNFLKLINVKRNVFNTNDLELLFDEKNRTNLNQKIRYYVNNGYLTRIKRDIFCLDSKNIDPLEVANKLLVPSYITGETVLSINGLSFQARKEITSCSYTKKTYRILNQDFSYHMLKKDVLFNPSGIIKNKDGINIASTERAILDMIYFTKGQYKFENIGDISFDDLKRISKIYNSKIVDNVVNELERIYKNV
jgi:hypothetical protein